VGSRKFIWTLPIAGAPILYSDPRRPAEFEVAPAAQLHNNTMDQYGLACLKRTASALHVLEFTFYREFESHANQPAIDV